MLLLFCSKLEKRHKITNDSIEETLSEQITNEQRLCTALNEEKSSVSAGGVRNGKKSTGRSSAKQMVSGLVESGDGDGSAKLGAKSRRSNKTGANRTKLEKSGLKKEQAAGGTTNGNLPLLTSILDDSLGSFKGGIDLISRFMWRKQLDRVIQIYIKVNML